MAAYFSHDERSSFGSLNSGRGLLTIVEPMSLWNAVADTLGSGLVIDLVPLGLGERAVGVDRVAHDSQILGVVGHGKEVERRNALLRLAHIFHGLAHRVLVGILRRGAGAEGEGVHGIAAVQMQVAEVGVLERIARGPGFCGLGGLRLLR